METPLPIAWVRNRVAYFGGLGDVAAAELVDALDVLPARRDHCRLPCRSALQPTGLFLLFYELLDSLRCLNAAWVSLSEGGW
jgi:hypothetical protein